MAKCTFKCTHSFYYYSFNRLRSFVFLSTDSNLQWSIFAYNLSIRIIFTVVIKNILRMHDGRNYVFDAGALQFYFGIFPSLNWQSTTAQTASTVAIWLVQAHFVRKEVVAIFALRRSLASSLAYCWLGAFPEQNDCLSLLQPCSSHTVALLPQQILLVRSRANNENSLRLLYFSLISSDRNQAGNIVWMHSEFRKNVASDGF